MLEAPENFSPAALYREKGKEGLAASQPELGPWLQNAMQNGRALEEKDLAALYHLGAHEAVLALQEAFPSGFRASGLLACMACAIHFARREPQKAVPLLEYINSAEDRMLRLRTAELWPEVFSPSAATLAALPRAHLLLLTYNRAQYVEQALKELAGTDYPDYAVYIADNGSTDGTWEIVRHAADFFPPRVPVAVTPFPCNIGRPAGHNWLLRGHDHSQAEFIAIGDDDLTRVPPDWLTRMALTARAFPNAACVGGKGLDGGPEDFAHAMGRHIIDFRPDGIFITDPSGDEDLGQFDYIDMADHVTGCLHIYRRSALERAGIFDIRFSPCQFVDIDHHITLRQAGYDIIYNGLVSFGHLQAMGKAAHKDQAANGNVIGNMHKLLAKHDPAEVRRALDAGRDRRAGWLETGRP